MAYINSSKLHIFPASQRTVNTQDNWISEYNLSSIVNQFMDSNTTGFVISKNTGEDQPIEFNIKGYYFKVATAKTIVEAVSAADTVTAADAAATVEADSSSTGSDSSAETSFVTFGCSEDNYYTATIYLRAAAEGAPILLGSDKGDAPTSGTGYSLRLFKVEGDQYIIPATSRLSVVGLAPIGGEGLSISVRGSSIQSYSVEAESEGGWGKVKIENGKITSFTLDAVSDSNNSRVKIENGKITSFTLDDGTL